MQTVSEVAAQTGVTVRTLHHYDERGLVVPSARSDAGYRLYDAGDLERLQLVLYYRELGFGLDEIRELLDDPAVDRGRALRIQRELLAEREAHLHQMIDAVDHAIAAHENGTMMDNEVMFAVFGEEHRALQAEAEARWGETDAYRESQRRTATFTREDWNALKDESEAIMQRIADVYRQGVSPDSCAAMDAVEAHRVQISTRFYPCSHQMQVQLAEGYVKDPRFRATYEALADGLAEWVREAIHANASRAQAGDGDAR